MSEAGANGEGVRAVDGNLTNAAGGTITVDQNLEMEAGNTASTFSTAGTITIAASTGMYVNPNGQAGVTFDITGGTITNGGVLKEDWQVPPGNSPQSGGTLSVSGGTLAGGPILANAVTVSLAPGGSGTLQLSNNCTLSSGSIPAGYTVIMHASSTDGSQSAKLSTAATWTTSARSS